MDIAKNVFQFHSIDERGGVVVCLHCGAEFPGDDIAREVVQKDVVIRLLEDAGLLKMAGTKVVKNNNVTPGYVINLAKPGDGAKVIDGHFVDDTEIDAAFIKCGLELWGPTWRRSRPLNDRCGPI